MGKIKTECPSCGTKFRLDQDTGKDKHDYVRETVKKELEGIDYTVHRETTVPKKWANQNTRNYLLNHGKFLNHHVDWGHTEFCRLDLLAKLKDNKGMAIEISHKSNMHDEIDKLCDLWTREKVLITTEKSGEVGKYKNIPIVPVLSVSGLFVYKLDSGIRRPWRYPLLLKFSSTGWESWWVYVSSTIFEEVFTCGDYKLSLEITDSSVSAGMASTTLSRRNVLSACRRWQ